MSTDDMTRKLPMRTLCIAKLHAGSFLALCRLDDTSQRARPIKSRAKVIRGGLVGLTVFVMVLRRAGKRRAVEKKNKEKIWKD